MITEVYMPKNGMDMTEGVLVRWLKQEGDAVKRGEAVFELESDKLANSAEGYLPTEKAERGGHYSAFISSGKVGHEGGELLVRLRVQSPVKPVLYMRTCGAVLGENVATLCVPERAIHTQDGMTGVVVVDGATESFIPVEVIHNDNGNAYFRAIQQGLLFEGMTVLLF